MPRRPRTPARIAQQQQVDAAVGRVARAGARLYVETFARLRAAPSDADVEQAVSQGPEYAGRVLVPTASTREAADAMLLDGAGEGATVERRRRRAAGRAARAEDLRASVPARSVAWAERRAAALVTEVEEPARAALRAA